MGRLNPAAVIKTRHHPVLRGVVACLKYNKPPPGSLVGRTLLRTELGFLPGTLVVAGKAAPGGDPRVFRVDGSEIALRKETTRHLLLKPPE